VRIKRPSPADTGALKNNHASLKILKRGQGLNQEPAGQTEPSASTQEQDVSARVERWILEQEKRAAQLVSRGTDATLKRVSIWIQDGETPDGPISRGLLLDIMATLKPTLDMETGEIHYPGDPEWPRTGTLLDFLESQFQRRLPPPEPEEQNEALVDTSPSIE
jgi:hypothetical protein